MQSRNTSALRKGRISLAGARYFLTVCAKRPEHRLISRTCSEAITTVLARCETDGDWTLMAFTIMPDHLHIMATLSGRLSVGQVIGKIKALTKEVMVSMGAQWQENFHEHRLRPDDIAGSYARYIFLNPYRDKLIRRCEDWVHWTVAENADFDFLHLLDAGRWPPEEWLTADIETLGVNQEAIGPD